MKFQPIERVLKNGQVVTVREAHRRDAEALLQTVSRYLIDSEYLITSIDEFNRTVPDEKRWIDSLNNSRNSLLLVAVSGKKIIGNIDVKGESRKKISHNGIAGIGILKEWRGLGLGTLLMQSAINWAKECIALKILWLHVFAENTTAIALYHSLGFEKAGVQKNFIRNPDGTYSDNIIMRLEV